MYKKYIVWLWITSMALISAESLANSTTTALYKVSSIKHFIKLVNKGCIDNNKEKCARTQHWRVYYKAVSPYAAVKQFEKTFDDNVPQLNAVMQMTVALPDS